MTKGTFVMTTLLGNKLTKVFKLGVLLAWI